MNRNRTIWTQLEGCDDWTKTSILQFLTDNEEHIEVLDLEGNLYDIARNGGTQEIGPYLVTTEEP